MPSNPPPGLAEMAARSTGYLSLRAGTWVGGHVTNATSSSLAVTANRLYLVPFYLPAARGIQGLGVQVSTAGAAGTSVRLGVYRPDPANDYEPGARLLDWGTINTDSTGVRQVTATATLAAGLWYVAGYFSGTPTVVSTTTGSNRPALGGTSYGVPNVCFIKDGSFAALPDPAGTGLSGQATGPMLQVHLA